jgi:hypothetical protein
MPSVAAQQAAEEVLEAPDLTTQQPVEEVAQRVAAPVSGAALLERPHLGPQLLDLPGELVGALLGLGSALGLVHERDRGRDERQQADGGGDGQHPGAHAAGG